LNVYGRLLKRFIVGVTLPRFHCFPRILAAFQAPPPALLLYASEVWLYFFAAKLCKRPSYK